MLYDTPTNVFVAGFIGSPAMSLKTVSLTDEGGMPITVHLVEELGSDEYVHGP